jgi:hypothetical protein
MFEALFTYTKVLKRHREGPSADAREHYLRQCAIHGAARTTLLRIARELLVIAERIKVAPGQTITPQDVKVAGQRWAHYQRRRAPLTPQDILKNYSFKSQPIGCASLATWKSRVARPAPSQLTLGILLLTSATNAGCRRTRSKGNAGTWKGSSSHSL